MALKPFAWSLSALNDFESCPHGYAEKRVYKRVKDEAGPDGVWGIEVHKRLDRRLMHKEALPADMPYEKWARVIEKSVEPGDVLKGEMQMCINREFRPVTWFAKDAWCRGIIDTIIIKDAGTTAYVYDYKTGKVKDDPTQLKLFVGLLSQLYPNIQRFITKFIWLKHDKVTPANNDGDVFMKEWVPGIWQEILPRVKRMEDAYNSEVFPMKPNGLCKNYCPVLSCPHNGRHGR